MAPFEYVREANHPYNWGPETPHGHFKPTGLRHPSYSAPVMPFSWMLIESMATLGEEHALDVQAEREWKYRLREDHQIDCGRAQLMKSPKFNHLTDGTEKRSSPRLRLYFILNYDIKYRFGRDAESEAED